MKPILFFVFCVGMLLPGCAQSPVREEFPTLQKKVGGPCEGCEAIYEYGNGALHTADTLPDFSEAGPKLKISGTIYQKDGKTPAKEVILYIYHTNQQGVYPTKGDETGWGRRHGYLRGWVKTGADGRYAFYTLRPAAYPNSSNPQHIHATVKEPDKNEYWLDEFEFEDDPFLTAKQRSSRLNRGGSGIAKTVKSGEVQIIKRDIILGKNIPDYK